MTRFAIVIGIDSYAIPGKNLTGAVTDALNFATWALQSGGVEPENLRLLLSSTKSKPTELPYIEADGHNIVTTIQDFQNGMGAGADRLYFYYAGHGLSAPGAARGLAQEPVLIPSEVQSIQTDSRLLIGFSQIIPLLNGVDPQEQFFFFDACRDFGLEDFQPGLGQSVGPWMPSRADGGPMSAQFMLYATSPGKQAFELGRGVFGGALLEGLGGKAIDWSWETSRYVVRFSKLVDYVQRTVRQRIERTFPKDWSRYIQIPEPWTARGTDPSLADFSEEDVSTLPVRVRVVPSKARATCRISQLLHPPGAKRDLVVATAGPPALATCIFQVMPGYYSFQAQAERYGTIRAPYHIQEATVVDFTLKLASDTTAPAVPGATSGKLTVTCDDPTAIIGVCDPGGEIRGSGSGSVTFENLPAGIYRIRMITAEGSKIERVAEVIPGQSISVSMDAPGPRLGADQMNMLNSLGISSHDGYIHPSEQLDGFADARLASLLSFAAFAAQWPNLGDFRRLRAFGVRSMSDVLPGKAGLIILVGASGDEPVPGVARDAFLRTGEYVARVGGDAIGQGLLEPLPGFPAAAQATLQLLPGPLIVELRLNGLAPTRYALAALPDRVTVLVAVAEDTGEVEVQQYLLPIRASATVPAEYLLASPSNIRRVEVAQRYYSGGAAIPETGELSDLLYGKWLDPLLGCIAGYGLVRTGRATDFVGDPQPNTRPDALEPSAMRNMLKFFGSLPDSHVLAALCDPERRDEHFTNALHQGLPVFAEGFRYLWEWHRARAEAEPLIRVEPSALLPGSPWTAWVAARPAILIRNGSFDRSPTGWAVLEQKRPQVEKTIASVGRIRVSGSHLYQWTGTGFVCGPRHLLTASHSAKLILQEPRPGQWGFSPGIGACVDFGEQMADAPSLEVDIEGVVEIDDLHHLALLKLAPVSRQGGSLPPPLRLASRLPGPYEGRKVYVVGYAAADLRVDPDLMSLTFGDVYDVKRLQPGQILAVTPRQSVFTHDCFTLGGNAGSPVVDVETGLVIGMHYAGRWYEYKQGEATALWKVPTFRRLAVGGGGR